MFSHTAVSNAKLLGSESVDVWNHSWGGYWWAQSLSQESYPGTPPYSWPNGGVLWFIDPILALISAPFAFVSLALGYNVACFFYVALASWCIHEHWVNQWWPVLVAGAFACSGWTISEPHNGITEACNIGPAALALGWCTYAKRTKEWLPWVYTGLSLSLCFITSPISGLERPLLWELFHTFVQTSLAGWSCWHHRTIANRSNHA